MAAKTLIENNHIHNVAMIAGEMADNWGGFGVRTADGGNIIRGNRLDMIGYIGMALSKDDLAEKNMVRMPA